MLKAIAVGFVVFTLLTLGISTMPMQSAPVLALDRVGSALIDLGSGLGEMFQLPVTVPIYVTGQHGSLGSVQGAALQDRAMWVVALLFWAVLALLTRRRENGS